MSNPISLQQVNLRVPDAASQLAAQHKMAKHYLQTPGNPQVVQQPQVYVLPQTTITTTRRNSVHSSSAHPVQIVQSPTTPGVTTHYTYPPTYQTIPAQHTAQSIAATPSAAPSVPMHPSHQYPQMRRAVTPFSAVTTAGAPMVITPTMDRIRRDTVVLGPPRPATSHGHRREHSTPLPTRGPFPPPRAESDTDSDTQYHTAMNARPPLPVDMLPPPQASRLISNAAGIQPKRPSIRTRSSSSTSNASVHFSPDSLFVTFPTPQTLKLSNIPRFGSQSLIRALREKVATMWLPGIAFQKEGRGELIIGFKGLDPNLHDPRSGLSEEERRNWGIWTARGVEGITAIRLLTTLYATFAAQGFSYLSELHCLPPQLIFSTTPSDNTSRFFAVEITVSPLPKRKQKVSVLDDDGVVVDRRKVKLDVTHVSIRCVDLPTEVLKAVVGAIKNSGRQGAAIHKAGKDEEVDDDITADDLLEFGVQSEKWEGKGVYHIDSVISRGTGKRAYRDPPSARNPYSKIPDSQIIEADTDGLPVLLSHVLKALSSHGFRLESSVPLPLPVPLVDPFQRVSPQHHRSGFSSFMETCFGSDDSASSRYKGYGREAWMFRNVAWFDQDDG